ncbi:DUF2039 domain containing protein [Nitzschia inconspicua]|uniref:DUF2039 domain containing protein n=1 Tax=Nitzschia inconspicua TaxID=303405 RepID=A0A9K3K9N9_9STRA|nr:DUF2039 domain containing protein [Nitzschia inconspicua]KAG7362410.1 DUF2039 domain containing protein [Nitzschia inconspicua]
MPPPPKGAPTNKKKKKGPVPAHQNKFAFRHNPKSKLTEKILTSPNVHVCQRCYDKIEWRKQYRKYKPRTQPGTCNECRKRNVLAAYHTICTNCTTESSKAKEIIGRETMQVKADPASNNTTAEINEGPGESSISNENLEDSLVPSSFRACAVCVKELALPDPNDNEADGGLSEGVGRIRLRELKAMERQAAKAGSSKRNNDEDERSGENYNDHDSWQEDENASISSGTDDDDDDPFLKAIGGAEALLTGEAYQQKLLERLQQQQLEEERCSQKSTT